MARTRKTRVVYINGERWKIIRSKLRGKYGECDYAAKTIRIHETLTGTDLLDTLLHEMTHARWPDLLESSVEEFAGSMATVLDAEGFRLPEDHDG